MTDLLPPQSIEAERAVLGALLLDRDAMPAVAPVLAAGDFYKLPHADIYSAALALFRKREPVDVMTLQAELARRGQLDRIGGVAALTELYLATPTAVHAPHYAAIVAEKATRRRLSAVAGKIMGLAYDEALGATEALTEARLLLNQVAPEGQHERGMSIGDALARLADELDQRWAGDWIEDVVPTGFYDLDRAISGGGLERGQLGIFGARPGMGKTAFALQVALNAVRRAKILDLEPPWTVFFSSEMTTKSLCWRALAETTGIPIPQLKRGVGLTTEQKAKIGDQLEEMLALPLWIDDTSSPTVDQMHERLERLRTDRPVRLAFFDYLEQAGDEKDRGGNEEGRVSKIAAGLKRIAKVCDLSMVGLSQLNREVEKRAEKMPTLADLRQSGRVEQEADIVLLFYREDYYVKQGIITSPTPGKQGTCDVSIAKQRDGETGVVTLKFIPELTAFQNLDRRAS
jgi:replicative DNA helicase